MSDIIYPVGASVLYDARIEARVIDVKDDVRFLEWTAELGQPIRMFAHINQILPIDAPRFTYKRAAQKHTLCICETCNKPSILETFCYDCGECSDCCQCDSSDFCPDCGYAIEDCVCWDDPEDDEDLEEWMDE